VVAVTVAVAVAVDDDEVNSGVVSGVKESGGMSTEVRRSRRLFGFVVTLYEGLIRLCVPKRKGGQEREREIILPERVEERLDKVVFVFGRAAVSRRRKYGTCMFECGDFWPVVRAVEMPVAHYACGSGVENATAGRW
jgi:hypothetical protein